MTTSINGTSDQCHLDVDRKLDTKLI